MQFIQHEFTTSAACENNLKKPTPTQSLFMYHGAFSIQEE